MSKKPKAKRKEEKEDSMLPNIVSKYRNEILVGFLLFVLILWPLTTGIIY